MRRNLLLLAVITLGTTRLFAQSTELTLDRCIALALDHNQTLEQARANVRSASASVTGAFGIFLPGLSISAGYNRRLDNNSALSRFSTNGTLLSAAVPYSYSLGANANYTIFNGFSNTATYERANRNYDAAEFTLKRNIQDITYQVTQGYLNVMRTGQLMIVRNENLKVDKEQLDRVQAQYSIGTVPRANVLQQETQEANDEVALLQSRNDWNNAKNDLISLMGIDPAVEYTLSSSSIPDSISDNDIKQFRDRAGTVNVAIARSISNRYDVESSRESILGAEASISNARGGYYPNISASLSYGWNNSQFDNFSDYASTNLGVNLTMPIFDRFLTRTNVEIAEATDMSVNATYQLLLQQVRSQVKKAYYDLETAELQLQATSRAILSAAENRRTAQERYNLGAGTVLDFLTAESLYLTADVNRVNAVYNYLGSRSTVEYLTALMNR